MLIEIFNGVINRPYVFIFLATFAFIGITHLGLYRWLLFLVVGTLVAFVCEASSIRNGFPFGIYTYHPESFEGELSILGVPYWDCLSFSFLTYFSYTIALVLYSPLYKTRGDLQVLDTKEIRRSPRVLITAALFMMMIDTVTDPTKFRNIDPSAARNCTVESGTVALDFSGAPVRGAPMAPITVIEFSDFADVESARP